VGSHQRRIRRGDPLAARSRTEPGSGVAHALCVAARKRPNPRLGCYTNKESPQLCSERLGYLVRSYGVFKYLIINDATDTIHVDAVDPDLPQRDASAVTCTSASSVRRVMSSERGLSYERSAKSLPVGVSSDMAGKHDKKRKKWSVKQIPKQTRCY